MIRKAFWRLSAMAKKIKLTQSAGGVVLNSKNQVLVVNQDGNSWSLPKGHLDAGEGPIAAARREIHEETGVQDLSFIKVLGSYTRPRIGKKGIGSDPSELKRITLFLFRTQQMHLEPLDERHPQARWVPRSKVAEILTHPKDKEFFLRILNQLPSEGL